MLTTVARAAEAVTTTSEFVLPTPGLAAVTLESAPQVPQLLGTHYRARGSPTIGSSSVSQIHLGYYDPDGDASKRFL